MSLSPPTLLIESHDVSQFACQHISLTDWLQQRAVENNRRQGTKTRVVLEDNRVVGFYALAAGAVDTEVAHKKVRYDMPRPIPAVILGRLAVDTDYQSQGIGAGMLKDAVLRTLAASREVAARVLLAHAIDKGAHAFYIKHGFLQSPMEPLTVMLDLNKVVKLLPD